MKTLVPIFHGWISAQGKLQLAESEQGLRRAHLQTLIGQNVEIIVRRKRSQRSLDQNKWHWGIAIPLIADALGYDKHEYEDLHYAIVAKCFGTHFDEKLQQQVPNAHSSGLTTVQFSELMEWEVRWAATEFGIVVPLPNEAEAAA